MSGEQVELEGDAGSLVAALMALRTADVDFVVVGGLAVMLCLSEQHRVTGDIDGVFDNDTETPTTETLVARGIAERDDAVQRVTVAGAKLDVIDTFALPEALDELPDDPKDRLFVCAHRFAFEVAIPILLRHDGVVVDVRVATAAAIVAMKAHALRFASKDRRATKRTSDLYDLYRLAAVDADGIVDGLATAAWDLRAQVSTALDADLAHLEQDLARLRQVRGGPQVDPDDFTDVVVELTDRLRD